MSASWLGDIDERSLDDPAIGLENGELVITEDVLRREVFDPVIDRVGIFSCY